MAGTPSSTPRRLAGSPNWAADAIAALTNTLASIPDGLASAILAGVNPVSGLNSLMIGAPLGAVFSSAEFMNISATSALAVAAGSVLADFNPDQRMSALVTLTLMAGVFQLLLGIFKQGGFLRFVSNAVLTGFMTGIAVSIILGQLGDLTGYLSQAGNRISKTLDLALHIYQVDLPTTVTGLGTIGLILLFGRTRLGKFDLVLALVVATAIVQLWKPESVQLVKDISAIPRSLPMPVLPDLSLMPQLILGAISLALIGLIQGAGVSKTIPNSNGRYGDISQDFAAQGISNMTAGLFKGIPVGGSVSGTAVSVSAGAASRWACILTGPLTIAMVLLFAGVVERFPMPAIAGLLIVAGFQAIKVDSWHDVWLTGWIPRLVMLATFIATLLLPIQYAVLLGVVLSILLHVYQSSLDVQVKQLIHQPGTWLLREQDPPKDLEPGTVTLLNIYGSVFYASADILQQALPSPYTADHSVVILGLRGRNELGSTFLKLLERYAGELKQRNSKLMLAGVSPVVLNQLVNTGATEVIPESDILLGTDVIGESLQQAKTLADRWLETNQ